MPFLIILIGAVLAMTAYNDTQDQLATNLEKDLPGFLKWGAAVLAIVGLGFIPGFQRFSRMLLALVIVVIVLKNYSAILDSFKNLAGAAPAAGTTPTPTTPAAAYVGAVDPLAGLGGGSISAASFGSALGTGSGLAGAVPSLISSLVGP